MTEKNKGKKLLTWTLALSMTLALPPVGVFAEEGAGAKALSRRISCLLQNSLTARPMEADQANNKGTETSKHT